MAKSLADIEALISGQSGKPPIHLWEPELSGDIDIQIKKNGDWIHEGGLIKRKPLVKLFASILRRESDSHYYLVTPVEKWRIKVVDMPLVVIECEYQDNTLLLKTNTDEWVKPGSEFPLAVDYAQASENEADPEPKPYVNMANGVQARINRNVFYELVEFATAKDGAMILEANDCQFNLGNLS